MMSASLKSRLIYRQLVIVQGALSKLAKYYSIVDKPTQAYISCTTSTYHEGENNKGYIGGQKIKKFCKRHTYTCSLPYIEYRLPN